jgi:hypothetical protein
VTTTATYHETRQNRCLPAYGGIPLEKMEDLIVSVIDAVQDYFSLEKSKLRLSDEWAY